MSPRSKGPFTLAADQSAALLLSDPDVPHALPPAPAGPGPAQGTAAGGSSGRRTIRVALAGNPNSGKTTLFNALTGLHQKVGNYPGVTVEKKEGSLSVHGVELQLLDLPGTYSLNATSDDERVVRDALLGLLPGEPPADMVLVVVDASRVERHLFLATQVLDLGVPVVMALTMNDEARQQKRAVDPALLAAEVGVPVVEVHAARGLGIGALKQALLDAVGRVPAAPPWSMGDAVLGAVDRLAANIGKQRPAPTGFLRQAAWQLIIGSGEEHPLAALPGIRELAAQLRAELEASGVRWREAEARGRYAWIKQAVQGASVPNPAYKPSRSDRVDSVVTHPVWGLVVFVAVMGIVFQSIFTWAAPFMDFIDQAFTRLADAAGAALPAGPLSGLLTDGVIKGVGAVVIFLPQILLLFLFIALLEDSGYLARAAFLMNKHMRRAGLHGRSFIPMMSGFACAIPAIMATRTIPDKRDRLLTMLVVPLTSCSARLPVYTLMIAAFIPAIPLFAGFTLQGAVLWGAYVFSLLSAVAAAFVLRRTVPELRGKPQPFILELPPYRWPHWKTVLLSMWERGKLFLTQAGTVILSINIVLWFLASFPVDHAAQAQYEAQKAQARATLSGAALDTQLAALDADEQGALLRGSLAGRLGHLIEPAIKPLGFDWKIGIGLIGAFAAREVFVSTLAVVYNVGGNADEHSDSLIHTLQKEVNPQTGRAVYSPLVALNLIIFFILACQCMSTIAVVKRETGGWKWPLFMLGYMTALAWVVCFAFYQTATRLWPGAA
jgi:ferrous iron transport protein B